LGGDLICFVGWFLCVVFWFMAFFWWDVLVGGGFVSLVGLCFFFDGCGGVCCRDCWRSVVLLCLVVIVCAVGLVLVGGFGVGCWYLVMLVGYFVWFWILGLGFYRM